MSNTFLLRSGSALLREIVAAWISLTAGAFVFGLAFATYSASGEAAASVAASVVAIPIAVLALESIRIGRLKFPDLSISKAVPTARATGTSGWKFAESQRFGHYWESLSPEERDVVWALHFQHEPRRRKGVRNEWHGDYSYRATGTSGWKFAESQRFGHSWELLSPEERDVVWALHFQEEEKVSGTNGTRKFVSVA